MSRSAGCSGLLGRDPYGPFPPGLRVFGNATAVKGSKAEQLPLDVAVDEAGRVRSGASLTYVSTRNQITLPATDIQSLTKVGNRATIEGVGTLNGTKPGYGFVITVTDGAPDLFGESLTSRTGDYSRGCSVTERGLTFEP